MAPMISHISAWMVLVVAGLLEIVWAIGLKYADGFTRLGPSVVTVVAAGLSFWLLAVAIKVLPVGTAYAAWTGIGAVDFIDHQDGRQFGFEGFRQNVAGLRQRTFTGIDQQHDAIDHFQCALDLAAKIGVSRRVYDVDFRVVEDDGGVLCQDRDAALAFQLV